MSTELFYLTLTALFTALLWIPYILNMILVRGLKDAVGYPASPKPMAAWAQRMKLAHYNAVENLVVLAALLLVADALDVSNGITAGAAVVYFWARVVHYLAYGFAIPWVRTLSFAAGSVCQILIGWQVLTS